MTRHRLVSEKGFGRMNERANERAAAGIDRPFVVGGKLSRKMTLFMCVCVIGTFYFIPIFPHFFLRSYVRPTAAFAGSMADILPSPLAYCSMMAVATPCDKKYHRPSCQSGCPSESHEHNAPAGASGGDGGWHCLLTFPGAIIGQRFLSH